MTQWLGFAGAAALVCVGAWMNAPEPPVEVAPEPVVVAAPTPTTDANDPSKGPQAPPDPGAAPQGG